MTTKTEEREVSAAQHLEDALDDLNQARQSAQDELRSRLDSAISRASDALDDLRSDTEDRAESLRSRAEEKTKEWQHTLEDATEDVRRELGVRAVRAQRTRDALDAMADEINECSRKVTS
jgi:uncharacterized protein YicC (UPF0701 family)